MNYSNVVNKIDKLLTGWNKRCLTPIGKITVIKNLAISKLNHIIMACPVGRKGHIKQLENKFYAFLWDNKPDKVKRINVTPNYQKGGLKMINLESFVKAMKVTWKKASAVTKFKMGYIISKSMLSNQKTA